MQSGSANIWQDFQQKFNNISAASDLEDLRIEYLGKSGVITAALKSIAQLSVQERKDYGSEINQLKQKIVELIDQKKVFFDDLLIKQQLAQEKIDITLPAREYSGNGRVHPISQVIDEIVDAFVFLGFDFVQGPDIEDDFHNFTALNIPENHPARQMHDTFYLKGADNLLLRTHTSAVQIRSMKDKKPPFYLISAGRTYRCESDMTHTPMFHQFEGLVIDKTINMGHLKGCLEEFFKYFFEVDNLPVRFRPSFFPFTEPSAEVDIGCIRQGKEIKIGPGSSWLEILGCGMVHPKVLENVGLNSEEYQGFAFGGGVERLAMLKYGIADLRTFFDSDLRWLKNYGFTSLNLANLTRSKTR